MSAETFCRWQIVDCNVVNSALYLRHSLGGSARFNETINQLGFSENHVVIIDQSDACSQILLSSPGLVNSGVTRVSKTAKVTPRFAPGVTHQSRVN